MSGPSPPRKKPKPDEQSANEQMISKLMRELALKNKEIASKDEEIARLKEQRYKHSLKALVFEQMPLELANHGSKSSHTGQTKHMEAEMIETKIQLAPFTGKVFTKRFTEEFGPHRQCFYST